ncbi:MAG TPA: hypothetical protein DCS07_09565 [Bdellovibrionales bacterium]|nr:MAG: hypothetical protein A2Z97_13840 [Bdellovibrionales bacterium GWB1_52_6]OFZ06384.1 MAG: hypothetical protein A2X97_02890 [Bdellovibrionales bacterium GWA1_52_35]OFZ39967.1 MAG: hypothetical protein A2070_07955 [Bdellovibrionales bacterium GWC1_52_8]HAR42859.1 hypothetical protein [Bdellovibrionales bacterium]HCM40139.1 hypothetical protein [Bdellovibrionales bacterium]
MNAIELLKSDHRKVQAFFDEMDQTEETTLKRRGFMQLKKELDLHMYLEETFVYPLFAETDGLVDLIEDSFDDHQEIRSLLNLDGVRTDEELDDRVDELMDVVQEHVATEESQLFPQIHKILGSEKLTELGKRLDEERSSPTARAA